jgi:hypothetical protein
MHLPGTEAVTGLISRMGETARALVGIGMLVAVSFAVGGGVATWAGGMLRLRPEVDTLKAQVRSVSALRLTERLATEDARIQAARDERGTLQDKIDTVQARQQRGFETLRALIHDTNVNECLIIAQLNRTSASEARGKCPIPDGR